MPSAPLARPPLAAPAALLLVATAIASLLACGPQKPASSGGSGLAAGDELLGPGEAALLGAAGRPVGQRGAAASAARESGRWSVLLGTFTDEDHQARAEAFRRRVAGEFPQLSGAFISPRRGGSIVVFGRYSAPEDPAAQAALASIKAMGDPSNRPFPTAMLVRRSVGEAAGPPGPWDLRNLRSQFPRQRQLFTLEIAVWSTFGTREISPEQVRRSAEEYTLQLRARNLDAWYRHDLDTDTSSVTVGRFGSDAYDPRSTLYSPEVERLMRQFPVLLVNGEELLVASDRRRPDLNRRPLASRLVEVPFE